MIASVSGIRMRHVVPVPTVDSTSTEPPMASMFVRTTSIPTPRPDTLVTFAAVEKPGRNSRSSSSDGAIAATSPAVRSPLATAVRPTFSGSIPAPSSVISTTTWPFEW